LRTATVDPERVVAMLQKKWECRNVVYMPVYLGRVLITTERKRLGGWEVETVEVPLQNYLGVYVGVHGNTLYVGT